MFYTINENYFKIWSPNMAYVFGLWCADGSIYKDKFTISLKESDKYLLFLIRKDMQSEIPFVEHYNKSPNSDNYYRSFAFQISNKTIVQDIVALGGKEKKSLSLQMPDIPNEFLPHFVRGVFDGDGSIYQYGKQKVWQAGFYSGSFVFLDELQKRLISEIPDFKCSIKKSRKIFFLSLAPNNIKRLGNFMYNNNCLLFLNRKYEKFLELGSELALDFITLCKSEEFSTKLKTEILYKFSKGKSLKEIAQDFEIGRDTLSKALPYLGIKWQDHRYKEKGLSYLKETTKKRIKTLTKEVLIERLSKGESLTFLAESYKVSRYVIKYKCKEFGIDWKSLGVDKRKEFNKKRRVGKQKQGLLKDSLYVQKFKSTIFLKMCKDPATSENIKNNLISRLQKGQTIGEIAKDLGEFRHTISRAVNYFKIDWRNFKECREYKNPIHEKINQQLNDLTKDMLLVQLSCGNSLNNLAKKYGVHWCTLEKRCKEMGIDWHSFSKQRPGTY